MAGFVDPQLSGRGGSSGSSGSSSAAEGFAGVLQVLQAHETEQWVCLHAIMPILMHFLRQATATVAVPRSSGSNNSSSNQGPFAASMIGDQWLPAVLAPKVPEAYSRALGQLGCSRQVGLWIAMLLESQKQQQPTLGRLSAAELSGWQQAASVAVQHGLQGCALLMRAVDHYPQSNPQLAPLHLLVAAVSLQWLSSMPSGVLTSMQDPDCEYVCHGAAGACKHAGRMLMQQQEQQSREHLDSSWAQLAASNQTVAELSVAVLEKLLSECHALPNGGGSSSSSSSSSSAGGGSGGGTSYSSRSSTLM
jgi:hypothetical protein